MMTRSSDLVFGRLSITVAMVGIVYDGFRRRSGGDGEYRKTRPHLLYFVQRHCDGQSEASNREDSIPLIYKDVGYDGGQWRILVA